MVQQTHLASVLNAVDRQIRYDRCVKAILGNKAILTWILKCCVREFAPFDLKTIADSIEGSPDIASQTVHRNEALSENQEIRGDNTEDSSTGEARITYDIRFRAIVPDSKEPVELLINIEAQNSNKGYPLEKRVVYYLSRLISSQYGSIFTHSHYEKIEKVYSIWFCTGAPAYQQNTIAELSMQTSAAFGCPVLKPEAVDVMQGIIVNLGSDETSVDNRILTLMNTLLSKSLSTSAKKQLLQEQFQIAMTEQLESEVSEMCNLSQGLIQEGRKEGRLEGRLEGQREGRLEGQKQMADILYAQGVALEVIAAAAQVSVETVRSWLKLPQPCLSSPV